MKMKIVVATVFVGMLLGLLIACGNNKSKNKLMGGSVVNGSDSTRSATYSVLTLKGAGQ